MKRKVVSNLWFKDERAQSIALGFVIIIGILLTASIILLSTELPKQTKKFEAEHAVKVPQDFAKLGSTIDDVALIGGETASATCAIGLTSKSVPFVGVQASGGTLRFDNSSETFECMACAPGEAIANGSGYWNCNNFTTFDAKLHVDNTYLDVCAKLELDSGEDRIYDSGEDESLSGEYWCNNFTVINNTTLYTYWLTVHAKNITIGPNSSINSTGCGMAGGKTLAYSPWSDPGKGEGGGETPSCDVDYGGCLCGAGGGGAGYYSTGGNGGYSWTGAGPYCSGCSNQSHSGGQGGPAYENVTNTSTDMNTTASGSGGACAAWGQVANDYIYEGGAGGNGGGIIHLDAPILNIMGNVSVEGEKGHYSNDEDRAEDSAGGGGGGGSGGTIMLKGCDINISGYLSAKGGDGAEGAKACPASSTYDSNGGGGGGGSGGVIKIFYGINLSAPGGLANHTAVNGGAGGLGGVGNGTYCSGPLYPAAGGNGSAGGDGHVHNESYPDYVESVPHYRTGWLVSNVTDIGYNATGTNTSMIRYGTISWTETRPSGTNIYMKVRTSADANMGGAMSWEDGPYAAYGTDISDLASVSDGHRYVQWRAELRTNETSRTPVLHTVNISYEYGLPVIINCTGSIEFDTHYFSLPNYILVYEHGGIIKNQSEGELMFVAPPIFISGNPTRLEITAINLTGDNGTTGGAFSSAVTASFVKSDLLKGGLPYYNLTLNITTAYPTAWQRWFNKTCGAAGLVYGTAPGNYHITGTGTSNLPLSIVFYGNETNPVHLWLKESEVAVEVAG
ncbi:MAG: hypothetical protein WAV32_00150 [Halobacteriota archaeon]